MTKRLHSTELKDRAERREHAKDQPPSTPIVRLDGARIGIVDIETTPLELLGWGIFDQNFSLEQISKDWSIMSFAYKWLGEKKITYMDTGGRGASKVRDDKRLLKPLHDFLCEADIVIAQNGIAFDMRKINARLVEHGFKPPSPYRVMDTLHAARRAFAFTSHKLAWMTEKLAPNNRKDEHPEYPGFKLWRAALADDPKVWPVIQRYNKEDILGTEEVYLKIRPWIANHPNLGVYYAEEQPICPNCGARGSKYVWVDGYVTLQQGRYVRYQCQDCGKYSRGKEMVNTLKKRRTQLAG